MHLQMKCFKRTSDDFGAPPQNDFGALLKMIFQLPKSVSPPVERSLVQISPAAALFGGGGDACK